MKNFDRAISSSCLPVFHLLCFGVLNLSQLTNLVGLLRQLRRNVQVFQKLADWKQKTLTLLGLLFKQWMTCLLYYSWLRFVIRRVVCLGYSQMKRKHWAHSSYSLFFKHWCISPFLYRSRSKFRKLLISYLSLRVSLILKAKWNVGLKAMWNRILYYLYQRTAQYIPKCTLKKCT